MNDVHLPLSGPIGIFDSGIGGLSVARAVRQRLPAEQLIYIADTLHAPYGEKTDEYIYQRMTAICQCLQRRGVKMIVVACNTATTAAIARLRAQFSLPVIGVEPGIKPAVQASRSGVVGVLATPRTLQTTAFTSLAQRYARDAKIVLQPCPQLVKHIEALDVHSPALLSLLKSYIEPLLAAGADTLVLGCTHYNFVSNAIAAVAGNNVTIIQTEDAVAQQVQRRLQAEKLLALPDSIGSAAFYTSGDIAMYRHQLAQFWFPVAAGENLIAASLASL
jgi:glutamate racemase